MKNAATFTKERFMGSLIGLAAGDSLGLTVEFRKPGTFELLTDIVGGGRFRLQPGEWTDDTSMALCLGQSLLDCNGFNGEDQIKKYVQWRDDGYMSCTGRCFDIGNTVNRALKLYLSSGNPMSGGRETFSAGNGSLMRLTPVAMYFFRTVEVGIHYCGESSRTTHGLRLCVDACRYFGGLIIGALLGAEKERLLEPRYKDGEKNWERLELHEKIDTVAAGSYKLGLDHRGEICGDGYVVNSLKAALWAFYNSDNFKDGALLAVNLGDDADTTGAIYGQLAGAFYGINGIPSSWRNIIVDRDKIMTLACNLYNKSQTTG